MASDSDVNFPGAFHGRGAERLHPYPRFSDKSYQLHHQSPPLWRRRGLGWPSILWMGAAYGIFEEGVVINTWADPWAHDVCTIVKGMATGLCDYSRVGGINLMWALGLTAYHTFISIAIPILLVELLYPQRAGRAWLGRNLAPVPKRSRCPSLRRRRKILRPYIVET